jgi:hypothetical protein
MPPQSPEAEVAWREAQDLAQTELFVSKGKPAELQVRRGPKVLTKTGRF